MFDRVNSMDVWVWVLTYILQGHVFSRVKGWIRSHVLGELMDEREVGLGFSLRRKG